MKEMRGTMLHLPGGATVVAELVDPPNTNVITTISTTTIDAPVTIIGEIIIITIITITTKTIPSSTQMPSASMMKPPHPFPLQG
jgi:hypothetical protein